MSVTAMAWVWKHSQAKPTDKFVLLAIADVSSDEGEVSAYARSQTALMRKTGLDRRTIQRSIDRLVQLGEVIEVGAGDGRKSTDYYLPLGRPGEGRQSAAPGAADVHPTGGGEPPQERQSAAPIIPSLSVSPPSPSAQPAPQVRAQRLPDPFLLTKEMHEWAQKETPHVDVRAETARFVDYWRAESGARARKLDWTATWRNWMRRAGESRGTNGFARPSVGSRNVANLHAIQQRRLGPPPTPLALEASES